MNTVMDDNKMLTLVSNERIPLSDAMRMVFEIDSLKNATPATVSRAGILYINERDIGWKPLKDSWIAAREDARERALLPGLFDKYVEEALQLMRQRGSKHLVPMSDMAIVTALCSLLDGVLEDVSPQARAAPEVVEPLFALCFLWAMGGALDSEKLVGAPARIASLAWLPLACPFSPHSPTCFALTSCRLA